MRDISQRAMLAELAESRRRLKESLSERVKAMHVRGATVHAIATRMGLKDDSVRRLLKQFHLVPNPED